MLGFAGAPFSAVVNGRTVSADGVFTFDFPPGEHEISGTFSSGLMIIAFSWGSIGRGGVRPGSVRSLAGIDPFVDACAVSWGDLSPRQVTFRVRFTVTT